MGLLPCPFCGGRPLVLIQQDGLDRVMRIECMTLSLLYAAADLLSRAEAV